MYQRPQQLLLLLLMMMMMMMMTTSLAVSDEDYVLASTSRDSGSYHKTFHSYAFFGLFKVIRQSYAFAGYQPPEAYRFRAVRDRESVHTLKVR